MTSARGILMAGVTALVVTSVHAGFRFWPVARGTEIYVPAALVGQPVDLAQVVVQVPFARIELDLPHRAPDVTETFERVRRVGRWWTTGGGRTANSRRLRGRALYVQLTAGRPLWPGGPAGMQPATVSDAIVNGAVNLAGVVTRVREDGYLWLDFALGPVGVPREIATRARPSVPPAPRDGATLQMSPAFDPGVFAVLRVLPSGRAALVAVIVNGQRY